jgi:hypothetical protein
VASRYDTAIPGLNRLLRDLRALPKEYQAELRTASQQIADRYMVPAWKEAAQGAGPWGERIAGSVRSRRDRVPVVVIGSNRRTLEGGASPTMVRFPSNAGRVRNSIPPAFTRTGWMSSVQPAYIGPALREWGQAVSEVCADFNNGRVM